MNLYEMHERMTARLFPAYSSTDERFLALALCGEVGELANIIKKRWRDGADLTEEARDEIADCRVYLELIAKCFDIEGWKLDQRVEQKLAKVIEKHKARLEKSNGRRTKVQRRGQGNKNRRVSVPRNGKRGTANGLKPVAVRRRA